MQKSAQKSNIKQASYSQAGFMLLGMLVLMVIAGYALAAASTKTSELIKRQREQELLKIGDTFRIAIGNYYNQSPSVVKQYPPDLEALLKDNRFIIPKRYIRQMYTDPITQKSGWGLLEAPSGGIMGVYSLSTQRPFKTKGFRKIYNHFENQKSYGEWFFVYLPPAVL